MKLTVAELKKEFKYIQNKMGIRYIRDLTFKFLKDKGHSAVVTLFEENDFYNNFESYFEGKNLTEKELFNFYKSFKLVDNVYSSLKVRLMKK